MLKILYISPLFLLYRQSLNICVTVQGILIYTTGYSGGELCAQGLTALKNFGNRNASKVYFNTNKSTYVYSYITKDGQQCTRTPSGTQYVCAYSG